MIYLRMNFRDCIIVNSVDLLSEEVVVVVVVVVVVRLCAKSLRIGMMLH